MMGQRDRLFSNLVNLMSVLRSKEGCPWDRKQTHKSLKPYLVDETCEVLESIDKKKIQRN